MPAFFADNQKVIGDRKQNCRSIMPKSYKYSLVDLDELEEKKEEELGADLADKEEEEPEEETEEVL